MVSSRRELGGSSFSAGARELEAQRGPYREDPQPPTPLGVLIVVFGGRHRCNFEARV